MSATSRGLPVVTVSHVATGKDNRGYQRRESSLSGGQVTWLSSQGRNIGPGPGPILEVQRTEPEKTRKGKKRQLPFGKHLLSARHCARSGYILSFGPSKCSMLQKGNCSHKEKTDQKQEPGTAQISKCPEGKEVGINCQAKFR